MLKNKGLMSLKRLCINRIKSQKLLKRNKSKRKLKKMHELFRHRKRSLCKENRKELSFWKVLKKSTIKIRIHTK